MTKLKVLALLALAALAVALGDDLQALLSLDGLRAMGELHRAQGGAFVLGFFCLSLVAATLSLPGGALIPLAAGALFGLAGGALLASFAGALGATLAFLMSRFLLRGWVQARFGGALARLNAGVERDGALYLFALRVLPGVPACVINYGCGVTALRIRTYYLATQAGALPGTLLLAFAGTRLASLQTAADILSPATLAALALVALLPLALRKTRLARLGARDPAPGPARVSGAGLAP